MNDDYYLREQEILDFVGLAVRRGQVRSIERCGAGSDVTIFAAHSESAPVHCLTDMPYEDAVKLWKGEASGATAVQA